MGNAKKAKKKIWLHLEWSMRGQEEGKHISGVVLRSQSKGSSGRGVVNATTRRIRAWITSERTPPQTLANAS